MAAGAKRTGRGRPTSYKEEFDAQALKLCLLGATNPELAKFFEVAERTIKNWRKEYESFDEAIKKGKAIADGNVAASLYRRAIGYEHNAVKIITVAVGGGQGSAVKEVPYVERFPPDTVACIFWLKNRAPELWRDRSPTDAPPPAGDPAAIARQLRKARAAVEHADGLEETAAPTSDGAPQ